MHGITESEAESVISEPDFIEPSIEGRLNAWKKASEKYLRVTYKEEDDKILVISTVRKKKGWG